MTIAIMQPYFIPYLGYFQLMNLVDHFILYDDVNYIKKGWIDKNLVIGNQGSTPLKIPIVKASQNKKIYDCLISEQDNWKLRILKTLRTTYSKHPFYTDIDKKIISLIEDTDYGIPISVFNYRILSSISSYLQLETKISFSSSLYPNKKELSGQNRIIDICTKEKAEIYINPEGGRMLYKKSEFQEHDIQLKFHQMINTPYLQKDKKHFLPNLSIIDLLMNCSPDEIRKNYLNKFKLL